MECGEHDSNLRRHSYDVERLDEIISRLDSLETGLGRVLPQEWGRQESNLRRLSQTVYSRRPLTTWILPRVVVRF